MGIFGKKHFSADEIEDKLNEEIDNASQNPENYADSPKDFMKKVDAILFKTTPDFNLPEKIKTEIELVNEYLYYMIEIKNKEYDLPLYSEFKNDIEKYRSIAGEHGRQQKELLEQFRRDGYNGKKWICVNAHEEFNNHRRTHEQISRLDDPFYLSNDVKLMYPGDPNGPKEETAGCLCYMEPVKIERIFS